MVLPRMTRDSFANYSHPHPSSIPSPRRRRLRRPHLSFEYHGMKGGQPPLHVREYVAVVGCNLGPRGRKFLKRSKASRYRYDLSLSLQTVCLAVRASSSPAPTPGTQGTGADDGRLMVGGISFNVFVIYQVLAWVSMQA